MEEVRAVEIDYEPRSIFQPFHDRVQRWAVLVAHRRAGKTVACINELISRAVKDGKSEGRYAYLAPLYNQAKDVAWAYLKRYAYPLLADSPNETELRVDLLNGARVRLYGADNPDRLRGIYLDGCILDEFADMNPAVWHEVVRPALSDRGGWATFIGTPKGKNAFFELLKGDRDGKWLGAEKDPDWYSVTLKASETGIIPQFELDDALKQMGRDQFEQEYECSFEAAIKGAFYAEELRLASEQGRITAIPVDRAIPVHTGWDLGRRDSTAIWFVQCVGRERRLVDYYETSGVALHHYVEVLRQKKEQHGWQYAEHFFPHDIQHHELTSDSSRAATMEGMGISVTTVPMHNVLDGINAVRRMLDRTWIDPERCARGLEALKQYRREWDENLKDWKQNPLHDWSSHGADALRTFAAGFDDPVGVKKHIDRHRRHKDPPRSAWAA